LYAAVERAPSPGETERQSAAAPVFENYQE
jgi:hypothetical protein